MSCVSIKYFREFGCLTNQLFFLILSIGVRKIAVLPARLPRSRAHLQSPFVFFINQWRRVCFKLLAGAASLAESWRVPGWRSPSFFQLLRSYSAGWDVEVKVLGAHVVIYVEMSLGLETAIVTLLVNYLQFDLWKDNRGTCDHRFLIPAYGTFFSTKFIWNFKL